MADVTSKPRAVWLGADRVTFDNALDLSILDAIVDWSPLPPDVRHVVQGCRVVISKEVPLREAIDTLPDTVELICEAGTGTDNIDVARASARGIHVCNVPGYSTESVAQLTLQFLLTLASGGHRLQHRVHRGDDRDFRHHLQVRDEDVAGKTLGLVGYGRIGKRVHELAKVFGMRVVVHSPSRPAVSIDELILQSEFISLHCPLTPDTHRLINLPRLESLGGKYLINTSRGALVDQEALIRVMTSDHPLEGVALDVQGPPEPPLPDSALWRLERVLMTPHMGWKSVQSRTRLLAGIAANIQTFLRTGTPLQSVK